MWREGYVRVVEGKLLTSFDSWEPSSQVSKCEATGPAPSLAHAPCPNTGRLDLNLQRPFYDLHNLRAHLASPVPLPTSIRSSSSSNERKTPVAGIVTPIKETFFSFQIEGVSRAQRGSTGKANPFVTPFHLHFPKCIKKGWRKRRMPFHPAFVSRRVCSVFGVSYS